MKKHITYIILALLLAICLAPATVMAQGEETSEVESIEVTIKPILGATVGTSSTQNIAATHIKSFSATPVERTKGELTLNSVTWYNISNADYTGVIADDKTKMKKIKDPNEIFEDDYHYYVVVKFADYLKDTDRYLPFAKTVTGTIKDGEAVSSALLSDNLILSIEGYVDVKGIYDIDMTITAPALGAKADYSKPDFTVTDDVCDKNSGLGVITVDTKWYKVKEDDYKGFEDSAWEIMEKDEEYTTGYYYEVDLCIYVTNNKEYNWLHRKLSTHLTGSLNGEDFDYVGVMEGEKSATLSKLFNPLVEPTPTPIPTTTPVDDYTPPETGVYGPEDNSQNNNFVWTLLLVSGGAIAVSALANKKKKYNR